MNNKFDILTAIEREMINDKFLLLLQLSCRFHSIELILSLDRDDDNIRFMFTHICDYVKYRLECNLKNVA